MSNGVCVACMHFSHNLSFFRRNLSKGVTTSTARLLNQKADPCFVGVSQAAAL